MWEQGRYGTWGQVKKARANLVQWREGIVSCGIRKQRLFQSTCIIEQIFEGK